MTKERENSYVGRVRTFSDRKAHAQKVVPQVRQAIKPLFPLDAAKILAEIATEKMATVQIRNNRDDVNAACAALRTAIASLEAVDENLDG